MLHTELKVLQREGLVYFFFTLEGKESKTESSGKCPTSGKAILGGNSTVGIQSRARKTF